MMNDCRKNIPPALRRFRRVGALSAAPRESGFLLVRIAREHTAFFRFLLESYENLAYFTALEPKTALLKLAFSPHQRLALLHTLEKMTQSVPFIVEEWPFARNSSK